MLTRSPEYAQELIDQRRIAVYTHPGPGRGLKGLNKFGFCWDDVLYDGSVFEMEPHEVGEDTPENFNALKRTITAAARTRNCRILARRIRPEGAMLVQVWSRAH
jgi:hypothetical protein